MIRLILGDTNFNKLSRSSWSDVQGYTSLMPNPHGAQYNSSAKLRCHNKHISSSRDTVTRFTINMILMMDAKLIISMPGCFSYMRSYTMVLFLVKMTWYIILFNPGDMRQSHQFYNVLFSSETIAYNNYSHKVIYWGRHTVWFIWADGTIQYGPGGMCSKSNFWSVFIIIYKLGSE